MSILWGKAHSFHIVKVDWGERTTILNFASLCSLWHSRCPLGFCLLLCYDSCSLIRVSPISPLMCSGAKSLSHVWLFGAPWTVAHQASLSMGFSRQEDWSGLPHTPPGYIPDPGIKSLSLMSPALAGRFFTTRAIWKALILSYLLSFSFCLAYCPMPSFFFLSENRV